MSRKRKRLSPLPPPVWVPDSDPKGRYGPKPQARTGPDGGIAWAPYEEPRQAPEHPINLPKKRRKGVK